MSQRFYKALLFAAMSVLLHAAYSITEWRHFARNKKPEEGGVAGAGGGAGGLGGLGGIGADGHGGIGESLLGAVPLDIAIEVREHVGEAIYEHVC